MRYIKTFENYEKVNEEITIKNALTTLLASVIFSFKSLAGGSSEAALIGSEKIDGYYQDSVMKKEYVIKDIQSILRDLEKLKIQISDPKISKLIKKIDSLKYADWTEETPSEIPTICADLEEFIIENDIQDDLLSDSINYIRHNNLVELRSHYNEIMDKYHQIYDKDTPMGLILIFIMVMVGFCMMR